MCMSRWYSTCKILHHWVGEQFEKWGCFVYKHPKRIITCSLLVALIMCSGFLRFNIFGQTERIFYPQNSQIFRDLDRSEKYFNYYVQYDQFMVLKKNGDSVLTSDVFQQVSRMNRDIMSFKGYEKFCLRSPSKSCVIVSPLDVISGTSNFSSISKTLFKVYLNHSYVMANGHTPRFNFPLLFGNFKMDKVKGELSANVLRVLYPVKFAKKRHEHKRNSKWELKFLKYLQKQEKKLNAKGLELVFNAARSIDDSIEKNTRDNILLINAAIVAMVCFCAVAMTRFRSKVHGHFLLSLFGILCITLGIGAGFGLTLLIGQPYVGFVGVLPFLVLGIGIDDIFIIVNQVDHINKNIDGAARLGRTMKQVGFSITMTTMTDLVAFLIGTVSVFPAIRIFCIYAFLSIFFTYMLILTLFLALLSYDMKRIGDGRQDCLPCLFGTENEKGSTQEEELLENKESISIMEKMIIIYAEFLMKLRTKIFVVGFALVMLAVGIYGTTRTSLSFDYKIVGDDNNEHVKWITTMEKHFSSSRSFQIDIVLDQPQVDYSSDFVKRQFLELSQLGRRNQYFDENKTVNWYVLFLRWKQKHNITGDFYPNLHLFLSHYKDLKPDIVFASDEKILASRIHVFTKQSLSWTYRKSAMVSLRADLKKKLSLRFYPVTFFYIFASHLSVIIRSTLNNVGICSVVILLVTLPYVMKPTVSILLLLSFLSFILELLAVMHFWGLSLNSITMIVMVMAIGFTVDYSCHVTHAYLTSSKATPEKRVVDAMSNIGLSVLNGGLSTLTGVIILSISTSKLFFLFFKMMFTVITLGLVHGLVILPVLMTIFCREALFKQDSAEDCTSNTAKKENGNLITSDVQAEVFNSKEPLIVKITSL